MKVNVGPEDRVLRALLGGTILVLGIYFKSWWGLLGVLPILTALVRRCPAYVPLGLSTCRGKSETPSRSR